MCMTVEDAVRWLSSLCARGEHSCGELRMKMLRWGMPEGDIESVLNVLMDRGFVDDVRFAHAYVHDKLAYYGWGRHKIDAGLSAKGIPHDIRKASLDELDDDDYLKVLSPLLERKRREYADAEHSGSLDVLKQKLIHYALGRGFDYRIVEQCIDELLS